MEELFVDALADFTRAVMAKLNLNSFLKSKNCIIDMLYEYYSSDKRR
jgi:hypothetical protein